MTMATAPLPRTPHRLEDRCAVAGPSPPAGARGPDVRILDLFYTPPVLVVSGERVIVPVDVVCTRSSGSPCPARVTIGARADRDRTWQVRSARASKGMRFDLTA